MEVTHARRPRLRARRLVPPRRRPTGRHPTAHCAGRRRTGRPRPRRTASTSAGTTRPAGDGRTSTATRWTRCRSARPPHCPPPSWCRYVTGVRPLAGRRVGRRLAARGGARALLGRAAWPPRTPSARPTSRWCRPSTPSASSSCATSAGRYDGPGQRIPLERALTRAVDIAVAQCNDEVDELTRMGLQRTSVAMVPTGVDIEQFHPDGEAAPRDQRPRILSVGGLVRRARPGGPDPGDAAGRRRRAGDRRWAAGRPAGQPRRGAAAARAGRAGRRRRPGTAGRRGAARPDGHLVPLGGRGRLHPALLLRRAGVAGGDGLRRAGGRLRHGRPRRRRRRRGHRQARAPRRRARRSGSRLRRLLADNAGRFAYGHAAVDRVRVQLHLGADRRRAGAALRAGGEPPQAGRRPEPAPPVEAVAGTVSSGRRQPAPTMAPITAGRGPDGRVVVLRLRRTGSGRSRRPG